MPPGRSGRLGYIIGDYQVQVIFDNKSDFLYHIIFTNRAEGVALSPNHMMEQHLRKRKIASTFSKPSDMR